MAPASVCAGSLAGVWRAVTLVALVAALGSTLASPASTAPPQEFELGVVSNANARALAGAIGALGAPVARVEFRIGTPPSQVAPTIAAYARRGVRVLPLAGFYGRIPSAAEARSLAGWAHAFGPGGTFWQRRPGGEAGAIGTLAVQQIEFGNETNQAYQFGGCSYGCAAYVPRARAYALALKEAQEAIDGPAGDAQVGVLAIGDDGGTGSADWVDGMFEAVPDLAQRVAGWTAHAYGPRSQWQPLLDRLFVQMGAHPGAAALPVYITELGIATDNGRCLTNNFGWSPCLTYAQAARSLTGTLAAIRGRYGARIRSIFIYQAVDQRLPRVDGQREHYFGVLTANRRAKGAYTAAVSRLLRTLH